MHNDDNLYKEGLNIIDAIRYIIETYEVGHRVIMVRSFRTQPILDFYTFHEIDAKIVGEILDELFYQHIDVDTGSDSLLACDWTVSIYKNPQLPDTVCFSKAIEALEKGHKIYRTTSQFLSICEISRFSIEDMRANDWVILEKV